MQYNLMLNMMGRALGGIIKESVPDKKTRKAIREEYRTIIQRASDIGTNNTLLNSYGLAAYFIAMTRKDGLTPQENCDALKNGMQKSKLIKMVMGNADSYFSEKHMEARRAWSKATHERRYANDWVVDVVEKGGGYEFGFNYLECGVCKLCRDEGCPELARYLCSLDFMLVEIVGVGLDRTMTLAEGGEYCDFRFRKL